MALSKSAAGTLTTAVFVDTYSAGSGGTAYTVPSGKVFKGFLITQNSGVSSFSFTVNGSSVSIAQNSTYTHRNIPLTLPSETVVGNQSTNYFTLTGELVDGS